MKVNFQFQILKSSYDFAISLLMILIFVFQINKLDPNWPISNPQTGRALRDDPQVMAPSQSRPAGNATSPAASTSTNRVFVNPKFIGSSTPGAASASKTVVEKTVKYSCELLFSHVFQCITFYVLSLFFHISSDRLFIMKKKEMLYLSFFTGIMEVEKISDRIGKKHNILRHCSNKLFPIGWDIC